MSPLPRHHLQDTTWRRVAAVGWFVLIGLGIYFAIQSKSDVNAVGDRVTKIESPCKKWPNSKLCERVFEEAAASVSHRMACFFQHKAGVYPPSCRGVHLRVDTPTLYPGGDAHQTPSTAHQPPEPSSGGSPGSHAPPNNPASHEPETSQPPHSGTDAPLAPSAPPAQPSAPPPVGEPPTPPPPVNLAPTLEGVTETVCSVNALGTRICP